MAISDEHVSIRLHAERQRPFNLISWTSISESTTITVFGRKLLGCEQRSSRLGHA